MGYKSRQRLNSKLKNKLLGKTGLYVSEFSLGLLSMSPIQANLSLTDSINIIEKALKYGVNIFDTAESYGSQIHLGEALVGKRNQAIISTKSYASTYDEMARSFELSLKELRTDYIDIYHLHAPKPSLEVFDERKGALQFLSKMKIQKVIRAVGIATHNSEVVNKAAERDDIDVIFALINKAGLGIIGGSVKDMLDAIKKASEHGKGVQIMKPLAGGNLIKDIAESLNWVRKIEGASTICVGVTSINELLQDLELFGVESQEITESRMNQVTAKVKRLIFMYQNNCIGCGACVNTCPNSALSMVKGKPELDQNKCMLCGYCATKCPEFLIRII